MKIVAALVPSIIFLSSACSYGTTQNYRFKVYIETPKGEITESHVVQISLGTSKEDVEHGSGFMPRLVCEALPVHLANGRTAFVLCDNISRGWSSDWPWVIDRASLDAGREVNVYKEWLPTVVVFENSSDPSSIMNVKYGDPSSHLGKGYVLSKVTVQQTDDAVTRGIEKTLPWVSSWKGTMLGPLIASDRRIASQINITSFKRSK